MDPDPDQTISITSRKCCSIKYDDYKVYIYKKSCKKQVMFKSYFVCLTFIFFLYEAKLIEKKFYLLQKFCLIPLMQYFGDGKENDKSEAQKSLIVPTVNREF